VGAKNDLKDVTKLLALSNSKIITFAAERGISFHINSPLSPHHGGLWEAAVKSAKSHLRRVVQDHVLSIEEFSTLLCQVEAALNSRPLSPMSEDPSDFDVLTPGHFLTMGHLQSVPESDFTDTKVNRLTRWQLVQQLAQHFWRRWSTEYLHLLQNRPKWLKANQDLTPGDLVLMMEGTQTFGSPKWIRARVIKTFPGPDGHVRVVEVKTPDGSTYKRPIVRLSPLPIRQS